MRFSKKRTPFVHPTFIFKKSELLAAGSYDEVVRCTRCSAEISRKTVTKAALGHSPGAAQKEMDELKARGYTPMDWNVSTTDAAPDYPSAATMVEKGSEYIDQAIAADRNPVVLMHDSETKVNACEATRTFIEKYGAMGYDFRGLDDYYGEGITFLD